MNGKAIDPNNVAKLAIKNRYRGLITTLILFCLLQNLFGQSLFYLHSAGGRDLYLVNLDDCSATRVGGMPAGMYDIALSPEGQLFAISLMGQLYRIDKTNATGTLITTIGYELNALVYGPDRFLYGANEGGIIVKIDPLTGLTVRLGRCGYSSGGDLTFYEGELYLAATGGGLVKIDLSNLANSRRIGTMANPYALGLITVGATDCQGNRPKLYATAQNKLYEVDPLTAATTLTCTLPVTGIGGAASVAESSSFQRQQAGKDSSTTICSGTQAALMLTSYLRKNDPGGTWTDLTNSQVLSADTVAVSLLPSGSYRFAYIVGQGLCADTAVVTLWIAEPPHIGESTVTPTNCANPNGSLLMQATGAASPLQYSTDSLLFQASPLFTELKAGIYTLFVRDANGCTSTQKEVQVADLCEAAIYRPDSFTPNGDGINDQWVLFFPFAHLQIEAVQIFNRSGEVIYSRENLEIQNGEGLWDGMYHGKAVLSNSYAYELRVKFPNGKSYRYVGSIFLIR